MMTNLLVERRTAGGPWPEVAGDSCALPGDLGSTLEGFSFLCFIIMNMFSVVYIGLNVLIYNVYVKDMNRTSRDTFFFPRAVLTGGPRAELAGGPRAELAGGPRAVLAGGPRADINIYTMIIECTRIEMMIKNTSCYLLPLTCPSLWVRTGGNALLLGVLQRSLGSGSRIQRLVPWRSLKSIMYYY